MHKSLLTLIVLVISIKANAATLSFVPSIQNVTVGDELQIDIMVSDPDLGSLFVIDNFDIYTRFSTTILRDTTETPFPDDPSILRPTDTIFGGYLGVPGTETSAWWGVDENVALDIVRIGETSTLSQSNLMGLQSPSFRLGALYFTAINVGTSTFEFSSASLGDVLPIDILGTASVNVSPVPIPAAIWLFGSGLLGLIGLARRKAHIG